jgi:chromate transporter
MPMSSPARVSFEKFARYDSREVSGRLRDLAVVFGRLGATAFGGPAAHVALMREEIVSRRGWLDDASFLDLLGATNLIPGPSSTELAIHVGYARAGLAGLVVAGLAFILPAAAVTLALAWLYVRSSELPALAGVLYGVKPVVLAIVAQAIVALAPHALRDRRLAGLGAAVAVAAAAGANEIALVFAAGAVAIALARMAGARLALAGVGLCGAVAPAAVAGAATPGSLFLVFAKIGSVLFGSGYVLLAFLRADLVERLHWLSEAQLIDAVAVGQVTPGPVFTTATFIGYLLAGPWGALAATAGIFAPAFVFVALSVPWLARLRASPAASAFLDGVNAASLALMAVVLVQLARAALVDVPAALLAAASGLALLVWKPNPTWIVLAGAAAGWALHAPG